MFSAAKEKDIKDAFTEYPALKERLAEYLKPHLSKLAQSTGVSDTMVLTDEKKKVRSTDLKMGATVDGISIGGGSNDNDEQIKKLEHTTGITWKKDEDTEWYRPHTIRIYNIKQGWEGIEFSQDNIAFLSVGENTDYRTDSPVNIRFTTETDLKIYYPESSSSLDAIPLGGMVPYFGKSLPTSGKWIWADGVSTWPNKEWVPESLRGKAVPNMANRLIGGTSFPDSLGKLWDGGTLTVPGERIDAGDFSLSLSVGKDRDPLAHNDGSCGNCPIIVNNVNATFTGGHTIPIKTIPITSEQNPPFIQVRWIIRIG